MQVLKELTAIVGRNKLRGLEMKDLHLDSGSKLAMLYQYILDHPESGDKELAQLLYPEAATNSKFRYTKSQLKRRLLNYLFFIDLSLPHFTDRQKAFLECYKEWASVHILFGRGARKAGVDIALHLLRKAERFEFSDIVMDVSKLLRFHFGVIDNDKGKYQRFKEKYTTYEAHYLNENKAEELYTEIVLTNAVRQLSKKALYDYLEDTIQELILLQQASPTYKVQLYGYLLRVMQHAAAFDYQKMIDTCELAITFFSKKEYETYTPLQIFRYQQLIGYIQLRQFKKGRELIRKGITFLEEGTFNWFKFQESYFILAMHSKEYFEAYLIFEQMVNHNRLSGMPEETREIWKIYEAYLSFIFEGKEINTDDEKDTPELSKFRLGRFLNDTPTFSKEKRGMNIAILIIQVLIHIQRKLYNKAIDRIEALEKYITRYLKQEETIRSYFFIKMLLAIPANGFHKKAVLRHAALYERRLKATPIQFAAQDYKLEIVPYEILWQKIINSLEMKIHKKV